MSSGCHKVLILHGVPVEFYREERPRYGAVAGWNFRHNVSLEFIGTVYLVDPLKGKWAGAGIKHQFWTRRDAAAMIVKNWLDRKEFVE